MEKLWWITLKIKNRCHSIGRLETHKHCVKKMHGMRHNFFRNPKTIFNQMPNHIEDHHIKVVLTDAYRKQEESMKLKPYIKSTEQIHALCDEFVS